MQQLIPNIWCDGTADEARDFYLEAFAGLGVSLVENVAYPAEGLPDFQQPLAGKTLTNELDFDGFRVLLINADDTFAPNPSINFFVNFDPATMKHPVDKLDQLWRALSADGSVLMELGEYDFSQHYGWVADKFGVNWQLMLTDPSGDPRPLIVPQLMFCGAAQGKAAQAREYYLELFDGEAGPSVTYPDSQEVVFSDMKVLDTWVAAMDSAVPQPFTFSEGVSLMVEAKDQAELDRWWAALSTDPDAEQCGWCRDQFGVSWQVVPAAMNDLMQRPGAYDKLLNMKKIVIDEF